MRSTSGREAAARRSWSSWVLALAVVLLPAVATANDPSSLEPEQIRMVQRALHDSGQRVEITGAWDAGTRAALADFQGARGLPATGALDGATARALGVDPRMVMPVAGRDANVDPAVNCEVNDTVDCRPGE